MAEDEVVGQRQHHPRNLFELLRYLKIGAMNISISSISARGGRKGMVTCVRRGPRSYAVCVSCEKYVD
jgi:hypothetical protein